GVAALFPICVSLWSLSAEKKASRVGRYKARQEIQKNPEILRSYTDEEMNSVAHIRGKKTKKGFFEKIGGNFKYLGTYIKDKREYDKYNKEIYSKKEKLNKALLKVNVTDEQLKEAKHLQDKAFMSFEKMDEMSQRYSEDMEAASEIGKQLASTAGTLAFFGASAGLGFAIWKGKFPWHRVIKFLSNLSLKKDSGLRMYVDKAYNIINKNKDLKKAFNKVLSPSCTKEAVDILKNSNELKQMQLVMNLGSMPKTPNEFIAKVMEGWNGTVKDTFIAKWIRKLIGEGALAYGRLEGKLPKEAVPAINHLMGKKGNSFYQTYKTLINTSAIFGIPVLGAVIGVPYAFCSWLTNIQKKAGRIGIMQAMNDLDNNALYVNPNLQPQTAVAENKPQKQPTASNDMLANFVNKAKVKQQKNV
ncbi:MAG: hypothetical protein MJ180_06225, partial [Candidatus Gastranaerophilales bacterium]|nr:hypothetical protein [Candidatus Gastranaerophilales bacterium]